jgi:alpha-1,6-mannosyltransferase
MRLPPEKHKSLFFTATALVFCVATVWIGYGVQRADFKALICSYGLLFLCYTLLLAACRQDLLPERLFSLPRRGEWAHALLWLGLLLRVLLLFGPPKLSDDYARFLWDGRLWTHGVHPFLYVPDAVVQGELMPLDSTQDLYPLLNSARWHTVYPPVCQALFALAAWLFPKGVLGAVLLFKSFLLACEVGTLYLLARLGSIMSNSPKRLPELPLLYALNPLFIVEITGNCHFEGAMVFFMLFALYGLYRQKTDLAALSWALATATKLLPLMFVPLLVAYLGFRKGVRFIVVYGAACVLLFAPLLRIDVLQNMFASIDLYFQKFEFNASLYYLCRQVGYWQTGWNIGARIGPVLALVAAGVVGLMDLHLLWSKHRQGGTLPLQRLFPYLFGVSMLHLLCATTVHPWYVVVPAVFALLCSRRYILPALSWTALAVLSYSHYAGGRFEENYAWIAVEYILLGLIFCWAWRTKTLEK